MRKYIPLTLVFMSLLFLGAQKPFNQVFPPDVEPSDGFRSNRNSFSAVMDVLKDSRPEVTQEELVPVPALVEVQPDPEPMPPAAPPPPAKPKERPLHVLLVESDPAFTQTMLTQLQQLHHQG